MRKTTGELLGDVLGYMLGKGLSRAVDRIADIVGASKVTDFVLGAREVANMAGQATGRTVGRLFDLGSGLVKTAGGIITNDKVSIKEGLEITGGAIGRMAGAAIVGAATVVSKSVETAINAGQAVSELAKGNEEEAQKHWEKAKEGIVWTGKAMVASVMAIGPFEATGVVDFIPDGNISDVSDVSDANVPGYDQPVPVVLTGYGETVVTPYDGVVHTQVIDDTTAVAGHDGLLPDLPVNVYDADGDGFADPGTVDTLVQAGYVDDAHYVPDPPRDPDVVKEFLRMHGLDEVPDGYEVHHIVPLYAGGADGVDNLILVKVEDHYAIHHELDRMYHDEKGFPVK